MDGLYRDAAVLSTKGKHNIETKDETHPQIMPAPEKKNNSLA